MAELLQEELEPPRDLYRLREFAAYFSKNFKFGHQFWKLVNRANSVAEALEGASAFCRRNGGEDIIEE